MKNYELSFLVSPEISVEEAQTLSSEIAAQIQKEGGLVLSSQNPIAKTLGYKIRKQASALWINIEFSSEPDKLKTIEDILKKDTRVLRHILVIKRAQKVMNIRRREMKPVEVTKTEVTTEAQPISEVKSETTQEEVIKKQSKKVELKDIDEKLEEILGE